MSAFDSLVWPFFSGLAVSLGAAMAIWVTRRRHGAFSNDGTRDPISAVARRRPEPGASVTPRIGGLAVYAGYWAAAAASPPPVRELMAAVGAAAAPAFLAGAAEDVTRKVAPALRLAASMLAALAFCLLTGYAVARVQIGFLDGFMAYAPVSVAVTVLAVSWMTQAMNIVDGLHGLAAGSGILFLTAFAAIAVSAGDRDMAVFCFVVCGALLGFLVVNFPGGHLFLGDGGAYLLGFVVACVAVMLPARNPDLSPWTSVVVLAYPLLEVAFAVVRKLSRGRKPWIPDRLHLHMLVYRRWGKRLARATGSESAGNPAAGMLLWGGPAASLALVAILPLERAWMLFALALLTALYAAVYALAARSRAIAPAAGGRAR